MKNFKIAAASTLLLLSTNMVVALNENCVGIEELGTPNLDRYDYSVSMVSGYQCYGQGRLSLSLRFLNLLLFRSHRTWMTTASILSRFLSSTMRAFRWRPTQWSSAILRSYRQKSLRMAFHILPFAGAMKQFPKTSNKSPVLITFQSIGTPVAIHPWNSLLLHTMIFIFTENPQSSELA